MNGFNHEISLGEGLLRYFKLYDLGDGGYTDRWFKIKFFWKFGIILPNISSRVAAVKFHDLHHVLTEYSTGFRGEAEIGAWEIASGCGKYYSAWILNVGSLVYGLIFFPKPVYRAFIRGRQSRNLYHNIEYNPALLSRSVGEIRAELGIPPTGTSPRIKDIIAFCLWSIFILANLFGNIIPILAIIKYLL